MFTTAHLIDMSALSAEISSTLTALVETDTALARAARGVVLDAPARVHLDQSRVQTHGDGYLENSFGGDYALDHPVVEPQKMAGTFDE